MSSLAGQELPLDDERVEVADQAIFATLAVVESLDGLVAETAEKTTSAMQEHVPTDLPTEPMEAGKGGEGGDPKVTNAEFVAAVFTDLPEGAFAAVCSKPGNPNQGGWIARRAD